MNFRIEEGDISDGYHTFGELYAHRVALFTRLCRATPDKAAWRKDENTPGWIILYLELEGDGQISYHIPDRFINKMGYWRIKELPDYKWDGHDSYAVLERLESI